MERYEVSWTPESREDYANILRYLDNVWGANVAINFMEKTDRVIENIEINPFMYPAINQQQIRRVVIVKTTSLYYYITPNGVEILYFWDNRRNPDDNPLNLG